MVRKKNIILTTPHNQTNPAVWGCGATHV